MLVSVGDGFAMVLVGIGQVLIVDEMDAEFRQNRLHVLLNGLP
jgi:hypothetical protein